ncbi:uncharacterized protein LOC106868623 [Octopus bimaculoides]|uniref:GPR180-like N-terminal domain-containing protein n=1 Tax=Octopus bimaculoides TaxID=37653 RepID=A0A0L8HTV0_OCTBM|nr:uncharacterized protein LOC106868623 [Octopus bimaculoides]|eukprot:XP_014769454.1 PREDICTED: uncharacterized protein LOC106868623 [Octopus bimaculoides]
MAVNKEKPLAFTISFSRPFYIDLFVLIVCVLGLANAQQPPCIVKGCIYTRLPWYGYLIQKTFHRDMAKIQYQLWYPVSECCANLLIYYDDQLRTLNDKMSCSERERILPADNNQIIPLYTGNHKSVGCKISNETGKSIYVCIGERTFRSTGARTWYFAISRCSSKTHLNLNYFFNITGFYGTCEEDALSFSKTYIPPKQNNGTNLYAVIFGVVSGVMLILAVLFFSLWCVAVRRKTSGSVTSSQATMTHDIFYVNHSLSDREQADYSQSSSENYYEVIPERRSYESISAQAASTAERHHSLRTHATLAKEHRTHTTYIFDDYPPPPYHPPQPTPSKGQPQRQPVQVIQAMQPIQSLQTGMQTSLQPSMQSTMQPSMQPSLQTTLQPSLQNTLQPSLQTSMQSSIPTAVMQPKFQSALETSA